MRILPDTRKFWVNLSFWWTCACPEWSAVSSVPMERLPEVVREFSDWFMGCVNSYYNWKICSGKNVVIGCFAGGRAEAGSQSTGLCGDLCSHLHSYCYVLWCPERRFSNIFYRISVFPGTLNRTSLCAPFICLLCLLHRQIRNSISEWTCWGDFESFTS